MLQIVYMSCYIPTDCTVFHGLKTVNHVSKSAFVIIALKKHHSADYEDGIMEDYTSKVERTEKMTLLHLMSQTIQQNILIKLQQNWQIAVA